MPQSPSNSERSSVLDSFEAPDTTVAQVYTFETDEVTALCPFDFGGPDYYKFTLKYIPSQNCVESKSLKKFLESYRDVEITAEGLGAEMYEEISAVINPKKMYLRLEQARRGGIEETVEFGDTELKSA
jgi:7-cyano-7-deazaguanine reductase